MKLINEIKGRPKALIAPGAVAALLIVLGVSPALTSSYTTIMISSIIMYIIMSLSWSMFSGATGYISLASAAFFGIGVYVSAFLGRQLPVPLLMLIGGAGSFAVAVLIGAVTLRLRGVYFTIFTLGLVELMKHLMLYIEITVFGIRGRFVVACSPVSIFYYLFILLLLVLAASVLIKRSRFGMALVCIAEGEDAAMHIGINATGVKILAFGISSFAMGAAGAAMATRWSYIDPYIAFGTTMSFMPVLMVIFGGKQNILGPLVGAAVFAYLQELLITKIPYIYMIAFGLIMIAAILFMPRGIVGVVQSIAGRRKGREGKKHADLAG